MLRLLPSWPLLASCLAATLPAQRVALLSGPVADQLTVASLDPRQPAAAVVLPGVRKFLPISTNGRTVNEAAELRSVRVEAEPRHGLPWLECGRGRLAAWQRVDAPGYGLTWFAADGSARDVFTGPDPVATPVAVATDRRHAAFVAAGDELRLVRLDGPPYTATGATWRSVVAADAILPQSVVLGQSHVFFVTDDDRVWRCGLGDGAAPVDITPAGAGSAVQDQHLAIAGDGATIAFLRSGTAGGFRVHAATTSGPSWLVDLPERAYRPLGYLPEGDGNPRVLLSHDGSRVMVVEADVEDEVHCADTLGPGQAVQVTGDERFAAYIGAHILPKFVGRDLLFASGHQGWADWYAARPDGTVVNVTQTGSPEPPFFVGSLAVAARYPSGGSAELSLEQLGAAWQLRRIDPAGGDQLLVGDALAPPLVGASLSGQPDLLLATPGGLRLCSGTTGAVVAAVPAGIAATPPVRAPLGWLALHLHLGGGPGITALRLDDGTLVAGALAVGVPQLAVHADGSLASLWPDRLVVQSPAGSWQVPLPPANVRCVASGAVR